MQRSDKSKGLVRIFLPLGYPLLGVGLRPRRGATEGLNSILQQQTALTPIPSFPQTEEHVWGKVKE